MTGNNVPVIPESTSGKGSAVARGSGGSGRYSQAYLGVRAGGIQGQGALGGIAVRDPTAGGDDSRQGRLVTVQYRIVILIGHDFVTDQGRGPKCMEVGRGGRIQSRR